MSRGRSSGISNTCEMRPGSRSMSTTRSPRHTASRTLWVTNTDSAAEIGSTARSSPGLTPVRHGRTHPFPLHDGARLRAAHLLAKSPDWLKAAPMRENLLASWRQSGQKQDHCPSLLNHNAKYKRLLPPCCDFANGVRPYPGLTASAHSRSAPPRPLALPHAA